MTAPPHDLTEQAPASDTPDVIHLPYVPPSVLAPEKKKPRRRRGHVDHFRTDDEEHAELASRARDAGLSVDAFCRLKTLGTPGPRSRRTTPTIEGKLLARLVFEQNHIGNNINGKHTHENKVLLQTP